MSDTAVTTINTRTADETGPALPAAMGGINVSARPSRPPPPGGRGGGGGGYWMCAGEFMSECVCGGEWVGGWVDEPRG